MTSIFISKYLWSDRVRGAGDRSMEELNSQERRVLELLTRGHDNRAIAVQLGITYPTVGAHVRSIITKLGARSRVDALARAYKRGLVSRPES